jgi:hypothetical protein
MMGLVQMARRCCSREPGGFPCCTPRPRDDPPSNIAIDRKSMIDSLYGPVAEPLNGMMVRKSSLGWNPNFKEYPYDDPVVNSSRTLFQKYRCGGVTSQWCDQEWTARFDNVLGLSGTPGPRASRSSGRSPMSRTSGFRCSA